MTRLSIRHTTTYRYDSPISLGPHRLMLRPREGHELRVLSMKLEISPRATVTWTQDVAGNVVASARFDAPADSLTISSAVELELNASPWPIFDIAAHASSYPFRYGSDEFADLGELKVPQQVDPTGRLRGWVEGFVRSRPTDTLALLRDINNGISGRVTYQRRDAEGTQSPLDTLDCGSGSCRDLAILFIEAVRVLGFGARVVSGYLHGADEGARASGANSTHAWAEVYVPGAGWIAFDPTNRSVGGATLVPVAVGRGIQQVMPVVGSFVGSDGVGAAMSVDVCVATPRN